MLRIDGYLIDAAVSEEPSRSADVTEYPVESGATITDHVRNKPLTLELEFKVSDTPIGQVATARQAGVVPSSEARQFLEALQESRRAFTVITARRTYESMVFASLSFPRDNETGDVLVGRASLQRIEVVNVRRVSVDVTGGANHGQRTSRSVAGKKLWLCPGGVRTSSDDATNKRNKCRAVITEKGRLVFADTHEPLSDAQIEALNGRLALSSAGFNDDRPQLIKTATKGLEWDPVSRRYIDTRQGIPIARQPDTVTTFEAMSGLPADYTPPTPPSSPVSSTPGKFGVKVDNDFFRSPYDR